MADITMCNAKNCPKSVKCYRHEDSGTKACKIMQTYWSRDKDSPIGDLCDMFWEQALLKVAEQNSK